MLFEILLFIPVIWMVFYFWWTRNYNHWKNKGVPFISPSFPFGNVGNVIFGRSTLGEFTQNLYNKYHKSGIVGFYSIRQPTFIVTDPELVKDVMVKDFNNFADTGMPVDEALDPMIALNPFGSNGARWKKYRAIQSHAHSIAKIKGMVPLIAKVTKCLLKHLHQNTGVDVNVSQIGKFFLNDSVASCAYSAECDSFTNPDNPFIKRTENGLFLSANTGFLYSLLAPWMAKLTKTRIVSTKAQEFFEDLINTMTEHRKKTNEKFNDLIQQLITMDDKAREEGKPVLTTVEKAAILMTFFLDGVESVNLVLSVILFEIAANPDVQEQLRNEIRKNGSTIDDFDYDKIWSLEYLNMVISEALRKNPPVSVIGRGCSGDTELGGKKIDKGTKLFIPVEAFHKDPRYFPQPGIFDPERFSEARKSSIQNFTFLPFGGGPRLCVGSRWGQTALKTAIVGILLDFTMTLSSRHKGKDIVLDKSLALVNAPLGDIWIQFKPTQ